MSTQLTDSTIISNDIIEPIHIVQTFQIIGDTEDGQAFYRDDVGLVNAYKVDFSGAGANKNRIAAYKKGLIVIFKPLVTNTGASTLQVIGPSGVLTALALTKAGSSLSAGDLPAGQIQAAICNDLGGGSFRFDLIGHPGNLSGLTDVTITSPTTGQVLRKSAGDWVNANLVSSDLPTHTHSGTDIVSGTVPSARLGSGTPDASKFLRGDGTWTPVLVVGMVMPYAVGPTFGAGPVPPAGWLFCFGQNVSRTTYSALFAVMGTTYGVGDGSTTFSLPDLRGRVVAGKDDMGGTAANRITQAISGINALALGGAGGTQSYVLTTNEIPSHSHALTTQATGSGNPTFPLSATGTVGTASTTQAAGGGAGHQNMQPTMMMNFILYTGV